MLTRAGGHTQGIAKDINPVIVRLQAGAPQLGALFEAIWRVMEVAVARPGPSVLLMPFVIPRRIRSKLTFGNADGSDAWEAYRHILVRALRLLADQGMTLVTSAGNGGLVSPFIFWLFLLYQYGANIHTREGLKQCRHRLQTRRRQIISPSLL